MRSTAKRRRAAVLLHPCPPTGPPRDLAHPSVNEDPAEVIDPNRCLRPLQRAQERREAKLKGSHHGAEFKDEPLVDRDPRSHEYLPQEGACLMCDQDVAEGDWYADIAFCKLCAKTAGPPEPLK